jgi:hypothetical protein
MKTVAIESLRRHLGEMLRSEEPVLVTRYGKLVGVFSPVHDAKSAAARFKPAAAAPARRGKKADPQLALLRDD